jgi:uncharacterized protein YeaO (DUF488 family)
VPQIKIKRAYDPPKRDDGYRVLVDRMWPRGLRKEDLKHNVWAKDIAPSTKLRQWFGHDPQRWPEFKKRYTEELRDPAIREHIKEIVEAAKNKPAITLLYGAKDAEHNQAVVLRSVFERLAR